MDLSFQEKMTPFLNRLRKVWKHYTKIARRQQVTCYRFYDHDMPEFPFAIDWYEGRVHVSEYKRRHGMDEEAHSAWLRHCSEAIAETTEVSHSAVYIKQRQKKAGRLGQYERLSLDKTEHLVHEGGLSFITNLSDYLDTGLFLDHRITREMVRKESEGKDVLNVFCYTGSFSVYAAAGHARTVTSVDLSRTYLHWAKRNMQYNKLYRDTQHSFLQEDVLDWIRTLPENTYDLIVCDPPTFSNSKKMEQEFDVQRDHVWLLAKLLKACRPGGKIYFSNNYRQFQLDEAPLHASKITDITHATTPFDFEGRLHRVCFLLEK